MKPSKIVLTEFVMLFAIGVIAYSLGRLVIHFWFYSGPTLDLLSNDDEFILDLKKISLVLFLILAGVLYSFRFVFSRPRRLYTGIPAFVFLIALNLLLYTHSQQYVNFRALTGDDNYEEHWDVNREGLPAFDSSSISRLGDHWKAQEERWANEVFLMRSGFGLLAMITFFFLVISIRSKTKNRSVQNSD